MKKELSIVLLFSRGGPFFMSARPILDHFLPIFNGFSSKLPGIANFSLKIVIFCHFKYFSTFLVQNSVRGGGATFTFRPVLAVFLCTP